TSSSTACTATRSSTSTRTTWSRACRSPRRASELVDGLGGEDREDRDRDRAESLESGRVLQVEDVAALQHHDAVLAQVVAFVPERLGQLARLHRAPRLVDLGAELLAGRGRRAERRDAGG